jgi:hypothetical protein
LSISLLDMLPDRQDHPRTSTSAASDNNVLKPSGNGDEILHTISCNQLVDTSRTRLLPYSLNPTSLRCISMARSFTTITIDAVSTNSGGRQHWTKLFSFKASIREYLNSSMAQFLEKTFQCGKQLALGGQGSKIGPCARGSISMTYPETTRTPGQSYRLPLYMSRSQKSIILPH